MSEKIEHGVLKFRPRARLLYLLGHELISDETIAMIELVKNCYDADSKKVRVNLTDVTNKDKGRIEVRDDGHGMSLETIRVAWMEPARDNKRGEDGQRGRTVKYHRLPLGEKGVGRFSADKLGLHLEIISRFCRFDPKTQDVVFLSPLEVVVKIEGNKFLESAYLDEIECVWETRIPQEFKGDDHGTLLRISQLRSDWDRKLVKKVHLGLARLSSPISKAKDFEIWFKSNNFKEFNGLIQNPLLKNAPYLLDADIDSNGIMTYTIRTPEATSKPDTVDLRKGQERFEIKRGKDIALRIPTCGPFRFKLYAFERDKRFYRLDLRPPYQVRILGRVIEDRLELILPRFGHRYYRRVRHRVIDHFLRGNE